MAIEDGILKILENVVALEKQVEELQAFKDFVHERLDRAGVPTHTPGPHFNAGCRIGRRLDWLLARANTSK